MALANGFKIGDRVMLRPPKWDMEMTITRHGAIEEIYNTRSTCHGLGDVMVAVRWDEGDQTRDHLASGLLEPEPIPIPTFQVADEPAPVVE